MALHDSHAMLCDALYIWRTFSLNAGPNKCIIRIVAEHWLGPIMRSVVYVFAGTRTGSVVPGRASSSTSEQGAGLKARSKPLSLSFCPLTSPPQLLTACWHSTWSLAFVNWRKTAQVSWNKLPTYRGRKTTVLENPYLYNNSPLTSSSYQTAPT